MTSREPIAHVSTRCPSCGSAFVTQLSWSQFTSDLVIRIAHDTADGRTSYANGQVSGEALARLGDPMSAVAWHVQNMVERLSKETGCLEYAPPRARVEDPAPPWVWAGSPA